MTSSRHRQVFLLGFALGILGYILPWVQHAGAGLSLHAFDMAAWSVRHIDEFRSAPVMLTSFLLRGQLLILAALWVGDTETGRWRWLVSLLLVVALLPPPDGIIQEPGNPNYRQLLVLALVAAACSTCGARLHGRWRARWLLVWALLGIVSSALAITRAADLYRSLRLETSLGPGAPLLWLAYTLFAITAIHVLRRRSDQSPDGAI